MFKVAQSCHSSNKQAGLGTVTLQVHRFISRALVERNGKWWFLKSFKGTNLYKWILKYTNTFSIVNGIPVEVVVVEVVVVVGLEVVVVVVVGASVVVFIRQQLLHCQGWTQTFKFYEKYLNKI